MTNMTSINDDQLTYTTNLNFIFSATLLVSRDKKFGNKSLHSIDHEVRFIYQLLICN